MGGGGTMTRIATRRRAGKLDRQTARILPALEALGGLWIPTHGPDSRPIVPGLPDILGFRGGLVFAVECKRPGEKLGLAQVEMRGRLQEQGIVTIRAESPEEAVRAVTETLGYVRPRNQERRTA